MDDMDTQDRGLDPNSATGTKDAVDPKTGALGTGGTPLTTGYGISGSTIGTGSVKGEEEHRNTDSGGATPDTKDYMTGQGQANTSGEPVPAPKPSQAEGDRETIEEDIREKEMEGQL